MTCPTCKTESKVLDSRPKRGGIRRRRECLGCKQRFTTVEHVVGDPDFDSLVGLMGTLETVQRELVEAMSKTRAMQASIGS